jgi:hypothetical protein
MIVLVTWPLLAHPWTLGAHNWDQMNTQREVVVKTMLRFRQFPFWDPYECGGHSAWGALESDPIVVSPWLPVYLLAPLPIAIRIEILVSALVGAAGCWVLASRFTESRALKALLTVLVAVDGRWGQQIAVGHTWHLLFGLLPWILYFFDRAIEPAAPKRRARRDIAVAALCLAAMVYGDGIYPVPHTAITLVVCAAVLAISTRSWRPVRTVALIGGLGAALAAPKLLPLLIEMQRFPRLVHSEEAIWPWDLLRVLTLREGDYTATSSFTNGMWHEWGTYLGWPGLALLLAGLAASRGPRERALTWTGLVMIAFVIGGFHPLAPWRLLHRLPLFGSLHVPSRMLYPVVIVLATAAVSGLERLLRRAGDRRAFYETALGFAVPVVALDIGLVAQMPIAQSFVHPVPDLTDEAPPFHIVSRLPPRPDYEPCTWNISTLPGVLENVGTMECDTHNVLHTTHRDEDGRMLGVGARGADDPEYRGEAYVAEANAPVRVVSWTPNEVEVHVDGARAGEHLVLNQNWDPGWSADATPAVAYRDAVATVLGASSQTVRFRYRSPLFGWGLLVACLAVGAIGVQSARARRSAS